MRMLINAATPTAATTVTGQLAKVPMTERRLLRVIRGISAKGDTRREHYMTENQGLMGSRPARSRPRAGWQYDLYGNLLREELGMAPSAKFRDC
ncbi:hypothetical protein [Streptomyces sp. NPDC102487]|uniref:hypothetical protein n=1 Tax=Streptomyces sp. NPDC102487 TaxID=3366182 RepID=UPI00380419B3